MADLNQSSDFLKEPLWRKVALNAVRAGKELFEKGLILYEALKDKDTPAWARGVIIAALGYLISPLDLVPDAIPFIGLADDFVVLALAVATVAVHIKDVHVQAARERLKQWFPADASAQKSGK